MTEEKNKLQHFKEAVFSEAEGRANSILKEAEQIAAQRTSEAEKELKQKEASKFSVIDKMAQSELTRKISAQRLNAQKNILLHRGELSDKIFESVRIKLDEFRKSSEYEKCLVNFVNKCTAEYPDCKGIIYLGKADEKYREKLQELSGFEIEIKADILLGGLSVFYNEINILLDCTFDSALARERENFCRNSELAI